MYGRDIRREEASYANDTSIEQARWSKILGVCSFLRIRLQKTASERISHFAKKDLLFGLYFYNYKIVIKMFLFNFNY